MLQEVTCISMKKERASENKWTKEGKIKSFVFIIFNSANSLLFKIKIAIMYSAYMCRDISTHICIYIYQFSSVTQSCPTLCDSMNCSMPGLPVHHQLPEFTQTHVHWVGNAIQPSHPLLSPSPPAFNSQHQGLFQWVNSLHQVAKVLEFQPQHQSFQWIFRTDFL